MSALAAPISIMRGHTSHTRTEKVSHAFSYGVTLLDVDVDQLDAADACSPVFSIGKSNLISLSLKKRGDLGQSTLSDWARATFASADIETDGCAVRLITFPTTEFYTFAPISIWLLISPAQTVRAVIYEVNNTFGERHSYVAKINDPDGTYEAEKDFHVSPFFDRTGRYRFTLRNSDKNFALKIENIKNDQIVHSASLSLKRQPATTKNFLHFLVTAPFSGLGVTVAIHWEALKLFLKGVSYHPKPGLAEHSKTYATETHRRIPSARKSQT